MRRINITGGRTDCKPRPSWSVWSGISGQFAPEYASKQWNDGGVGKSVGLGVLASLVQINKFLHESCLDR